METVCFKWGLQNENQRCQQKEPFQPITFWQQWNMLLTKMYSQRVQFQIHLISSKKTPFLQCPNAATLSYVFSTCPGVCKWLKAIVEAKALGKPFKTETVWLKRQLYTERKLKAPRNHSLQQDVATQVNFHLILFSRNFSHIVFLQRQTSAKGIFKDMWKHDSGSSSQSQSCNELAASVVPRHAKQHKNRVQTSCFNSAVAVCQTKECKQKRSRHIPKSDPLVSLKIFDLTQGPRRFLHSRPGIRVIQCPAKQTDAKKYTFAMSFLQCQDAANFRRMVS